MDELQTIRECIENACQILHMDRSDDGILGALHALYNAKDSIYRLEARAAEMPDAKEIVDSIIDNRAPNRSEAAELIGQYAYRYTEDIRKDRDYWKDTATAFHDAIHQHIENHQGDEIIEDISDRDFLSKLPIRTRHALTRAKIYTRADLMQRKYDLYRIQGLGKKSINEIEALLK